MNPRDTEPRRTLRGHKVRAVIRVVVCECGWQARSDQVVSLDGAFRDHATQAMLVSLRKHLTVAP